MLSAEDLLLALAAHACPARRTGVSAWCATCPRCGSADALRLSYSPLYGVGVLCSGGCGRDRVLAALGLDEGAR